LLNSAGGERGIRGFATLEFQLMLLRRMADYQPELVREATAALGVSWLALREANRRWQLMVRSATFPEGLDRLRLILGPPETLDTRRFGDAVHEAARWRLPLWPDLRWEALVLPGGPSLQEWLVRPDPATRPALATAADVLPWSAVVADLQDAFGPVEHEDGDAPSRWTVVFASPGEAGRYVARFTHGLVQTVSQAED
jgi:hypothetical protein